MVIFLEFYLLSWVVDIPEEKQMMHCGIEGCMVVSVDALLTLQPKVIDYAGIRANKKNVLQISCKWE